MPKMYGSVIKVLIKGRGRHSAELQFSVTDGKRKEAFVAHDKPRRKTGEDNGHEPQVFAGMAALLSAAYFAKEQVEVEFATPAKGETPEVISVGVATPSAWAGKKRSTSRKRA